MPLFHANYHALSSNISRVQYDPAKMELLVCFKSGTNQLYRGVDQETFDGLDAAQSKGKYLHAQIVQRCEAISVDRDGNAI